MGVLVECDFKSARLLGVFIESIVELVFVMLFYLSDSLGHVFSIGSKSAKLKLYGIFGLWVT